jgi:hypothetical protein
VTPYSVIQINTWIVGPGKYESKAANLVAHDDTEYDIGTGPYDDELAVEEYAISALTKGGGWRSFLVKYDEVKFECCC